MAASALFALGLRQQNLIKCAILKNHQIVEVFKNVIQVTIIKKQKTISSNEK